MYVLRTAPCFLLNTTEIDETIRSCIETLMNVTINASEWMQICLPVKSGGVGIQSVAAVASSAYISSVLSTTSMVRKIYWLANTTPEFTEAVSQWQVMAPLNAIPPRLIKSSG